MEAFDFLWKALDQIVLFSSKEKAQFFSHLEYMELPAKTQLVPLDKVARYSYFIIEGSMRFYYISDEGKEITGFIFTEGLFASSLESFIQQMPSQQVLETIENCKVLRLSFDDLQQCYDEIPKVNVLVRKILEQRLAYAQNVIAALIGLKPADRYQQLSRLRPDLIQRIPQHILASYMGITPVSLSRIRGRK